MSCIRTSGRASRRRSDEHDRQRRSRHLDLATVIKVSQAVSGEIVLEKLIDTLMRTAIEHAGAERGLLILPRGDEQRIEAEARTGGDKVSIGSATRRSPAPSCRSPSFSTSCAPTRA